MAVSGCYYDSKAREIKEEEKNASSLDGRVSAVFLNKETSVTEQSCKRKREESFFEELRSFKKEQIELPSLKSEPVSTVALEKSEQKIDQEDIEEQEDSEIESNDAIHELFDCFGNFYQGEMKDGRFHGEGKYVYSQLPAGISKGCLRGPFDGQYHEKEKAVYEGEFKDHLFEGEGVFTFKNGDIYEGEFRKGKFHGAGTFTYATGAFFEGHFIDGFASGAGRFTFPNGDVYAANFRKGYAANRGALIFANGGMYGGPFPGLYHIELIDSFDYPKKTSKEYFEYVDWVKYSLTEEGKMKVNEGILIPKRNTYKGETKNGLFHGEGVFTYSDCCEEAAFRGPFDDQYHELSGAVYEGMFDKNLFHGRGILKFSNGDGYQGEFADGIFHGEGTFTYATGAVFTGQFIEGLARGPGVFNFPNGDVYEALYHDGLVIAGSQLTFSDGTIYKGAFPGLYHGELIDGVDFD